MLRFWAEYYTHLAKAGIVALSRGVPYARWAEWPRAIAALAPKPGERVLDFGTGMTPFAHALAAAYGCRVTAIDSITGFAKHQDSYRGQAHCVEGDVERTAHLAYDGILAISTLEHILDEGLTVRAMAGLLKPGGRMVITVPYDPWRDSPRYYRASTYSGTGGFYMRYYNDQNLTDRIVGPSGLREVKRSYWGEPGLNAHNRIFGNDRILWPIRRLIQPLAPLAAAALIRDLEPRQFRKKEKLYTADTALVVLER